MTHRLLTFACSAITCAVCAAQPLRISVSPNESLVAVRDRVRALSAADRQNGVEIVLAPGDYFLPEGLTFEAADGGATDGPSIAWRAEKPGTARLIGARHIPAASFAKVADPAILARLPEEARGKVFAADVKGLFPGGVPSLAKSFGGTPEPPMVFMRGTLATLARWPNGDGWMKFSKGVDHGTRVGKHSVFRNGAFICDDPRMRRWDFSKGVWLNGYFTHDWHNQSIRVAAYGPENGTNDVVRLDGDMPYGVLGGTWGRKSRRFRAFNLLEELDTPGEWWIDREKGILYLVPLGGGLTDDEDVRVACFAKTLVTGKHVCNLRFEGIQFAFNHGSLVSFTLSRGVTFANCRFLATGRSAVTLDGEGNALTGCEIANCGEGGVHLSGGDRRTLTNAGSRVENCRIHDFGILKRTYAGGIRVSGCGNIVRGNEIWNSPHTAVFHSGNEHLLEYNNVHHVLLETGDAGAFYTGRDWTTMGNVLRYNYVHDLGAGTSGAEGQDTAVSDVNTMGFYFDDCDCGDSVYGNVFHNVARGIMIGGGREHPVRNNIFSRCRIGMSIDCRGMTWTKRWNTPSNGWNLEVKAKRLHYQEEPWKSRYPLLAKIMEDHPREPLYNPVENNIFIDCSKELLRLGKQAPLERMAPIAGNVVVNTRGTNGVAFASPDPRVASGFTILNGSPESPSSFGFVDAGKADFRLLPDAELLKVCPGFKPIPLDRIPGR